MRLVVDASVAIKLYVAESDSQIARTWIQTNGPLFVPDLFFVEVGQALLRHHREGRLSLEMVKAAVDELAGITESPGRTTGLLPRALDLAAQLVHGLHDCVYLALAERLSCPLLTADAKLAGRSNGRACRSASHF